MKKAELLKIVNIALFIFFLNQGISGFLHSKLPHEVFEILHEKGALVLMLLTAIHLYLNWSWIKSTFLKRLSTTPKS